MQMKWIRLVALQLYDVLTRQKKKPNRLLYDESVRKDLQALQPGVDITGKQKDYVIEKLTLSMTVLVVGGLFSLLLWINEVKSAQIADNLLYRKDYGEGSTSIELLADNGTEEIQISMELEEREYSVQELEELYDSFVVNLEKEILGKNQSLEEIRYDLTLVQTVPGYPFQVEWQTDTVFIDTHGKLVQEKVEQIQPVALSATIQSKEFCRIHTFACCVYDRAEPFSFEKKMYEKLQSIEEASRQELYMELPAVWEEQNVTWKKQISYTGVIGFLITPILAIVLFWAKDRDLHMLVEKRKEEMKADYPEIVSKLALYMSAGMTVQNAWKRVATEYSKTNVVKKQKYAYEEMLLAVRELESGNSWTEVFERFSRRCALPEYTKLVTLLLQNIRKGNANLSVALREESRNAFEERKHEVRKQGEKAGTKLLAPMMLLLLMIMVMVMIPAFRTSI